MKTMILLLQIKTAYPTTPLSPAHPLSLHPLELFQYRVFLNHPLPLPKNGLLELKLPLVTLGCKPY